MPYAEFSSLLSGINPETPLGAVVAIRAEKDPKVIKKFNREQRRIYNEWRQRSAKKANKFDYEQAMKGFSYMFKGMAGGVK